MVLFSSHNFSWTARHFAPRQKVRSNLPRTFPFLALIVVLTHVFVSFSPLFRMSTLHFISPMHQLDLTPFRNHQALHYQQHKGQHVLLHSTPRTDIKHLPLHRGAYTTSSLPTLFADALCLYFPLLFCFSYERRRSLLFLRSPNTSHPQDGIGCEIKRLLDSQHVKQLMSNPTVKTPFILFRALGNDLPPRHSIGQTLQNVRFILKHEKKHANLTTRWYINRIVDPFTLRDVLTLLIQHNQTFVIDHAPLSTLPKPDYDFTPLPPYMTEFYPEQYFLMQSRDVLRSGLFQHPACFIEKRIAFDRILAPKSHALIHNNQARNKMLELGIASGAQYILPWDGNCFLSPNAWRHLTDTIRSARKGIHNTVQATTTHQNRPYNISLRYFYTPIRRTTSNEKVLHIRDSGNIPPSTIEREEPQIIFHREAVERFNEQLAYGCGPKVDLLYRLRIPGTWTEKASRPSNCFMGAHRPQSSDVPRAGGVLMAGWTERLFSGVAELEITGAYRGHPRSQGVEIVVAGATIQAAQKQLGFTYDGTLLYDVESLRRSLSLYLRGEDDGIRNVVENMLRDARFQLDEMVSIRNEGRAAALQVLAALFSREACHAKGAIVFIRNYIARGAIYSAHNTQAGNVCAIVDAVRLLMLTEGIDVDVDMNTLQQWGNETLHNSRTIPHMQAAYFNNGLAGVRTELLRACLCNFLRDDVGFLRGTGLSKGRLLSQMEDGVLATQRESETAENVEVWTALALAGKKIGENIWKFGEDEKYDGVSLLGKGVNKLSWGMKEMHGTKNIREVMDAVSCVGSRENSRQAENVRDSRLADGRDCRWEVSGFSQGNHALPPFWNLGLPTASSQRR